ncbi:MAG: HlyD family secretion protein [Thermoanaerobaculia bacterium]
MKRRILPLLVVLAAGAAVWYWTHRPRGPEPLVLSGTVEARVVEVGSLVGGRVSEVLVDEGSEVAAGAKLVVLEADLLDRQIDGARASVDQATAAVALAEAGPRSEARDRASIAWNAARTDLGRIEALYRDGVVGRADYDAAVVREATAHKTWEEARRGSRSEEIESARAALARARADLAYLEQRRAELTISAPADGRIESIDLRPGDLVAPNQPVATLLEPGEIWVRVYVPETRLGEVEIGQEVAIVTDSFPDDPAAGRVVEIRHRAEYLPRNVQTFDQRADQVFGVKVAITPGSRLRPGMAATVRFPVAERGAQ